MHTSLLDATRKLVSGESRPGIRLWLARRRHEFAGAALQMPGGALEFAGEANDAFEWARALRTDYPTWVGGEHGAVSALTHALGGTWDSPMIAEVMAATDVPPLIPVAGNFERATVSDQMQTTAWIRDFLEETRQPPATSIASAVTAMIAREEVFFWRVGTRLVSMVAVVARTKTALRYSLMYTSRNSRRLGYARACLSAAMRRAFDAGYATCCVHVRANDQRARSLYANLGYHCVGFRMEVIPQADHPRRSTTPGRGGDSA
ncbi:MAG: GNAT family N-acetyltransferase [Deltaproteobacteria bacterium]|nr:GNAT family N-acetyltransferase [Deltaproteobacteria bacterium]